MLSQGHPDAKKYPLWMLGMEAEIASEHLNRQALTQAYLNQAAFAPMFGEDGQKAWKKAVEDYTNGG